LLALAGTGSFLKLQTHVHRDSGSRRASYPYATRLSEGEAIAFEDGVVSVRDNPVIPFVEGDGTGPDLRVRCLASRK